MPPPSAPSTREQDNRISTGVAGLDRILGGGLRSERLYLVHGAAGTGKTTLGFQFLMAGRERGEKTLYVTLLQDRDELEDMARSHRWSLDGIEIMELPQEVREGRLSEQTVFSPADVDLPEAVDAIIESVEFHNPRRIVIDSISELGILVDAWPQMRRQILRLKSTLSARRCTALLNAGSKTDHLPALLTLVHGDISLFVDTPDYGNPRRKIAVPKMRAMDYLGGVHDACIREGGLEVFPRLRVGTRRGELGKEVVASGEPELDKLLGGGLEEGTSCLIAGSTGVGKSTLASLYLGTAAERGERSVAFFFDERMETFLHRSNALGLPVGEHVRSGMIDLQQINAGELSAGAFVHRVVRGVEEDGARIVVIDSLTGYLNAMPQEALLVTQLHELLNYLGNRGILTIMLLTTHGLFGHESGCIDASYVADTVILARHFEAAGALRQCLSVVKKRTGRHEKTIRELEVGPRGVRVGPPLKDFTGVLTGIPNYEGNRGTLLSKEA